MRPFLNVLKTAVFLLIVVRINVFGQIEEDMVPELYKLYREAVEHGEHAASLRRLFRTNELYSVHVSKLKDVNGFKKHNLLVKKNDPSGSNPIIYINNPVESKIPQAFLTLEEFKIALMKRVDKLNSNNRTSPAYYIHTGSPKLKLKGNEQANKNANQLKGTNIRNSQNTKLHKTKKRKTYKSSYRFKSFTYARKPTRTEVNTKHPKNLNSTQTKFKLFTVEEIHESNYQYESTKLSDKSTKSYVNINAQLVSKNIATDVGKNSETTKLILNNSKSTFPASDKTTSTDKTIVVTTAKNSSERIVAKANTTNLSSSDILTGESFHENTSIDQVTLEHEKVTNTDVINIHTDISLITTQNDVTSKVMNDDQDESLARNKKDGNVTENKPAFDVKSKHTRRTKSNDTTTSISTSRTYARPRVFIG